ncbi:hypothetical protein SISNIDRAFT_511749 [Sistotremastrum niveocremeum HHB9708]|uniref:Uncharacterized protein n=1 Tax=Sistotremastrum niveocremeum HHB9708 TaxID=1314777 RepID=A0A164T921_9AGAM|nr:hypothetical protein SISNIDRAFT_511749 [Sistotremastrum niveocremeum HHB9708]
MVSTMSVTLDIEYARLIGLGIALCYASIKLASNREPSSSFLLGWLVESIRLTSLLVSVTRREDESSEHKRREETKFRSPSDQDIDHFLGRLEDAVGEIRDGVAFLTNTQNEVRNSARRWPPNYGWMSPPLRPTRRRTPPPRVAPGARHSSRPETPPPRVRIQTPRLPTELIADDGSDDDYPPNDGYEQEGFHPQAEASEASHAQSPHESPLVPIPDWLACESNSHQPSPLKGLTDPVYTVHESRRPEAAPTRMPPRQQQIVKSAAANLPFGRP